MLEKFRRLSGLEDLGVGLLDLVLFWCGMSCVRRRIAVQQISEALGSAVGGSFFAR